MTTAEAREVLIRYNTWRRYDGPLEQTPLQPEPKEIGEAIDVAIEVLPEEEASLDEAARHVYESWMGGTMDDVRRDMVELGKVLNARKEDKIHQECQLKKTKEEYEEHKKPMP